MKRLLLSMSVLFAFTMTTHAQWGPGPGEEEVIGGFGGAGNPIDLIFAPGGGLELPSPLINLGAGSTFFANFIIWDSGSTASTSNFQVRMRVSLDGSPIDDIFATVSGFTSGQSFKSVSVSFTIPPSYSGHTLTIDHILIDNANNVSESNEMNNYVPSYYFESRSFIIM